MVNDAQAIVGPFGEGEWVFNTTFFDRENFLLGNTLGPIFNRIGKCVGYWPTWEHNAIWGRFYLKDPTDPDGKKSSFIFTIDNPYLEKEIHGISPTSVQRIRNSETLKALLTHEVLETRRYYDWDAIGVGDLSTGYFSDRAIMLSLPNLSVAKIITGKTVGFVIGGILHWLPPQNKLDTTRDYYSSLMLTLPDSCLVMANIGKVKTYPISGLTMGVRLTGAGNIVRRANTPDIGRTGVLYNINGQWVPHQSDPVNPDDAHDVVVVCDDEWKEKYADVPVETHLCPPGYHYTQDFTLGKGLPKLEFVEAHYQSINQNRTDTLQDWLNTKSGIAIPGLEALGAEYTFYSQYHLADLTIDVTQPLNTLCANYHFFEVAYQVRADSAFGFSRDTRTWGLRASSSYYDPNP
ncbi:hypothetical protein SPFM12_00109 [Salmonella phage SPFM12]|nr:hypothetical protein SPFM12_00109 [Salmonella phage SPFM12]